MVEGTQMTTSGRIRRISKEVGDGTPADAAASQAARLGAASAGMPSRIALRRLFTQLRRVLVSMHSHRMLHGRVEQLGLGVGDDGDRAVHLARKVTAVDEFASHRVLRIGAATSH
jgi:hypothetical protein